MKYIVDVPPLDSSKPWHIIKEFNTREEAVDFCKTTWGLTNCEYCMLSHDGEYWVVDTLNPCVSNNSSNNQFLTVEGFHHKSNARSFAAENYGANKAGFVSLLSLLVF